MKARWSRWLVLGLGFVGLLALALQVLALWLARPSTQVKLAGWLSQRLSQSLGEEVHVQEARLQLYPLQIVARGLRVGSEAAPLITAEGMQLNLGSLRLSDRQLLLNLLYLKGLRVYASGKMPRSSSQSKGPPIRVRIRQLVVNDANLMGLQLTPEMTLSFEDLELLASRRAAQEPLNVYLRIGELTLWDQSQLRITLLARARLGEAGLELRQLRFSGEYLSGAVQGQVSWQGDPELQLRGEVWAQLEAVDRFFGLGIDLRGAVTIAAEARITRESFTVDGQASGIHMAVAGFALDRMQGSVHISPEGLEAFLEEGLLAGGRVEGSYQLADFGPTFAHRVALRGEGVDLERFLSFLGLPPAGLAARAQVNAELAFDGAAIGRGQGAAFVRLAPKEGALPVEGQLAISLGKDALLFSAKSLYFGGGTLHWRGSLTLGDWRPQWNLVSDGVQVEAVGRLLAGWLGTPILPPGLSGTSVFDLTLSGAFTRPTLSGPVALSPVCLGPLQADALEGELQFSEDLLRLNSGRLILGRGKARFAGELDLSRPSPRVSLWFASEDLPLSRMAAWAGLRFPISGGATVEGRLTGSLDQPELEARMRLSQVSVVGLVFGEGQGDLHLSQGVLQVANLAVGKVAGALRVDFPNRHVEVSARVQGLGLEPLSPLLARLLGAELEAEVEGDFPWDEPSGRLTLRTAQGASGSIVLTARGLDLSLERPGRWQLSAEILQQHRNFVGRGNLAIGSLGALAEDLTGKPQPFDGHAKAVMDIALGSSELPEIQGYVTEAFLRIEGQELALTSPARFSLRGTSFQLEGLDLEGEGARLFMAVSRAKNGELAGEMSARVPASLLTLFWSEAAPQGEVELLGELSGTVDAPHMEGMLNISKGTLRIPGLPGPVTGIQGTAELVGESIILQQLRFAFYGGNGTCAGRIRLYPKLDLDLDLALSAVRWPLGQGFEPNLDGQLRLSGDTERLQLSGRLNLRRSIYQRDVNLQKLVLEELLAKERSAAPEKGIVAFDLRIDVPGTLEIRTPMARLVAQGELRLLGDSNQPGLLGRLDVLPGGEVELSGVSYEIDRAFVSFSDPTGIRPEIDLQAHGTVQDFTVNVRLSGTLDRLVPTLSSDPPLPESDILALMALGVAPGSAAASASASAVATSLLTEQLTGAVTERTRTLLALDQLRIDPFVTAETGTATARMTVAKQLSADWWVTVSSNLSSNREEVVVSRWRVGKDLFLEATRDTDGSYSLEVRWRQRY
ncbi:MAG: translocation/assembly module TamB domain-containing protein [Thermoanaerobaculaceae bacterium]